LNSLVIGDLLMLFWRTKWKAWTV